MTADELESNLGTIARSGSLAFKQDAEPTEDVSIIGQFGVGFYSAFMVSDRVTVKSRAFGSDEANVWTSDGAEGYTISPCEKESHGTVITMHIKENTEEESYDEFLDPYRLRALVEASHQRNVLRPRHRCGRRVRRCEREEGRAACRGDSLRRGRDDLLPQGGHGGALVDPAQHKQRGGPGVLLAVRRRERAGA